jgi:hypothetical protein
MYDLVNLRGFAALGEKEIISRKAAKPRSGFYFSYAKKFNGIIPLIQN